MTLDRGWHTIVVAASGPSVDQQQAEVVRQAQAAGRCRVIAVNTTWQLLPFADVLYAADRYWWRAHLADVLARFAGERWTIEQRGLERNPPRPPPTRYGRLERRRVADQTFHRVKLIRGKIIVDKPDTICAGGNSGFMALSLARLFGASQIVLVGFDMQRTGGKRHWHDDHPKPLATGDPASWISNFTNVAPALKERGVDVVNASKATALRCFRRSTIEEAFA